MNKKTDEKPESAVVLDQTDRPTLDDNKVANEANLSHNWQPNSPAVDLRYAGVGNTAVNILAVEDAAKEEVEEQKKAKPISEAEYERRTKLDVSDPAYINESLDHIKAK